MVGISVVVPCYNSSAHVENCLGMLQTQTFTDFEVICVNDGSTDNTEELCRNFVNSDSRFKIVSQENKGLGGARNTGIDLSEGKYITFVDSDDWVFPNYLEKLWSLAEDQNFEIVDAFYSILLPDGNVKIKRDWVDNSLKNNWLYIFAGHAPSNACCRLYKKSLLIDNKLYFPENRVHEDLIFTYRAYYYAKSSSIIEKPLYVWNLRPGSLSRTFTIKHVNDLLLNIRSDYDFAINNFGESIEYFSLRKLFFIDKIITRIKYLAAENDKTEIVSYFRKILKSEPLFSLSKIDADNAIALTGKNSINRFDSIKKNSDVGLMGVFYTAELFFTAPQLKSIDNTVTQMKNNQLSDVTFSYLILEFFRRIHLIEYKAARNTTIWFVIGKLFSKLRKR